MIPKLPPHILSVFGLAVALTGCGHPVQETAAHKIADALPSLLGPAAHYDVQVDGDPFALSRGRAHAVHIQGQTVQLSQALTLDTLTVDVGDISFSQETRRLDHVGRADFTAALSQEHLTAYLAHSKPLLPGLVVALRPDDVQARVPVKFLGLETTAALSGTFKPDAAEPSKLDFVTDGAQVGILPLPAGLVNLAVDQLNPVLSLSGLKAPLSITGVRIVNSQLTLQGTADLSGLTHREAGINR